MSQGWAPACALMAACSFQAGAADAPSRGSDARMADAKPAPDSTLLDAPRLACAPDGFSCGSAGTPGSAFSCNGSCWISCISIGTWATAEQQCEAWSGTLAIELDSADHDCIAGIFNPTRATWIGLELPTGEFGDMSWRWITQPATPPPYADWMGGTSGSGTGPLFAFQRTDAVWQAGSGSDEISSLACERPEPQ